MVPVELVDFLGDKLLLKSCGKYGQLTFSLVYFNSIKNISLKRNNNNNKSTTGVWEISTALTVIF